MNAVIVRINRSNGGVPKLPIDEVQITVNGLVGDRQRDRRFHGGSARALSLYSLELIEALVAEGHPGSFARVGAGCTPAS